jgi:hypothetical protein
VEFLRALQVDGMKIKRQSAWTAFFALQRRVSF